MKPIIFSTYSVRAIQDGRKTQTRRVIKPQPPDWCESFGFSAFTPKGKISGRGTAPEGYGEIFIKLIYQPGDIIWVKEPFCEIPYEHEHIPIEGGHITLPKYAYKADSEVDYTRLWKSPRFMPKKAARIFLLVKSVSVERLQDITEEDAWAEGMEIILADTCRQEYMEFWDHLNTKRGYPSESNPWVWKYEFERTEKPNGF